MQIAPILLCTPPFWTSDIIRTISRIPFPGRIGTVKWVLMNCGIVDQPMEWLLFPYFAVILAFVHLYTLFMVILLKFVDIRKELRY